MSGIDVQITDQGPATFEVLVADRDGGERLLASDHPDVIEFAELAYGRVLQREVRPLPAGTIRVRVPLDQDELGLEADLDQGCVPELWLDDVAEQVARRILA